ncbi:MEDS domain-containing protein [Rossellomorea sp. SC111]|uniref:MEDS domain-containing protein n=1 Tax=Rossellomorea sp. SC111 TaxID=2968985 RepID=UPI00215A1E6F|nr:MEDS domain-containing protein [Rossellomorea sp. SC111]MCR8847487.1 MEDS domain-containing protein [Rossellomorea sp. SC111]
MEVLHDVNLGALQKGHVFYPFQQQEAYIRNLMLFIQAGLKNNQHILIVESMKNITKVKNRMHRLYTEEQLSSISLVDNFDYYFLNGDFNTQHILRSFQKDLSIIKKINSSIRTWGHVEWVSKEPDAALLNEFESIADDYVLKEGMLSVCAYSKNSLSNALTETLEKVHQFVLTDENLRLSMTYNRDLF